MDVSPLLAPVVTIPVIAALTLTVLGQTWAAKRRLQRRLKDQARLLGKLNATMITAIITAAESEMNRRVAKAVNVTVDETLKAVGVSDQEFEHKLNNDAHGHPTFEDKLHGSHDPFRSFSLDDLAEALGGSHRQNPVDHAAEIFRGYEHNAGPLETAAAEGRTHTDVQEQDEYKSDGGTTLRDMPSNEELRKATGEGVGGGPRAAA